MNFKIIYILGSIVLFLGLIWMLLPHAAHAAIIEGATHDESISSHIVHTLEGLVATLLGLIIMVWSNRKLPKVKKNKD